MIDFELIKSDSNLNDSEQEKLFELMQMHQFGNCHSLTVLLSGFGLGDLVIMKEESSGNELIHSFVKTKNGLALDAGGLLPINDILERYITVTTNMSTKDFKMSNISSKDLVNTIGIDKSDIICAMNFWKLIRKEYGDELKKSLNIDNIGKIKNPNKIIKSMLGLSFNNKSMKP